MVVIPLFLVYKINKYLSCQEKEIFNNFMKVSGKNIDFMNIYKCRIIKYKNDHKLNCCEIHGNEYVIDAITNLNIATKDNNLSTIHFKSQQSLQIAKPYLSFFGTISHYCCNDTGVMYKDINDVMFLNKKHIFNI